MAFWAEEQKRAGERRGLGGLAAEPDPPRPETRGPTQSTAVRSTLKWHPPHPETGPGDAHE